ncbi:MAG: 4Fe-4S dicluster domain-containing protein [Terriglobales bacterium]
MKRPLLVCNVAGMLIICLFLGTMVVNALVTRQPWSLVCYSCKACNSSCVMGIDPQGFVGAALSGDPQVYVYATNIRLPLAKAVAIDPAMTVSVAGRKYTARDAAEKLHLSPDTEVVTYRVKARDAAAACLRCAACERTCVLRLPLLRMIDQLRAAPAAED